MAHSVSTNYLVHDGNGKPQVIKVIAAPNSKTRLSSGAIIRGSSTGIIKSVGTVRQLYPNDDHMDYSSPEPVSRLGTTANRKVISRPSNGKQISPDLSDWSPSVSGGRRRKGDKAGKGLRHFSMKVCEKVREKGHTTYNEVADELVDEFTSSPSFRGDFNYDQKNIRRRVYDALNVLMAMNIISKEKKEIRWLGLPSSLTSERRDARANRDRFVRSKRQLEANRERVAAKKRRLFALITQQIAFRNLIARNRAIQAVRGVPEENNAVQLPLLVVSTGQDTTVNLSVANDRREYHFSFDDGFEINDESHVLEGLGMTMGLHTGQTSEEDLIKAKSLIPKALIPYLEEMIYGEKDQSPGQTALPSSSNSYSTSSLTHHQSPYTLRRNSQLTRSSPISSGSFVSQQIEMLEDDEEDDEIDEVLQSPQVLDDDEDTASDSEVLH